MAVNFRLLKDGKTRRWFYRFDAPPGADGKRRQVSQGGFLLKREAETAERARRAQLEKPAQPVCGLTYGEYLDLWLEQVVRPTRAPNTYRAYVALITHHVRPALGAVPLAEIRPPALRTFLHALPLQPASLVPVRAILQGSLRQAVADELLERSPAVGLTLPRQNEPAAPPLVPDAGQVRELVRLASTGWLKVPVFLGMGASLGRGEVLGLRWEDVDLEAGVLQVRQQVTEVGPVISVAPLKRPSRRRAIQLAPFLVDLLIEHREEWREMRRRAGEAWVGPGHLVCEDDGSLIPPHRLTAHFERLRRSCGLEKVSFHKLRHLVATVLLEARIPTKVVSEIMGHSSQAITAGVYQHVTPVLQAEASLVLDRALRAAAACTESAREVDGL